MPEPVPIEQLKFDEDYKPIPIDQLRFDKGFVDRAGEAATRAWDAARGAVRAINKTAAGEVDVSGIVSQPPGPAGMFNAEKTMVSGPTVPDNLIPSHITMQDRIAFEAGGGIAAGAPEDLKTLVASHAASPVAAISTDTTPKPGIAARIFRPSDVLTPEMKNRATDVMTLSRMTKLPPSVVEKNFDAVAKEVGARGTPTLNEMAAFMMTPAIAAGLATNPLMTTAGLIAFEGVKEGESLGVQAVQGKPVKFRAGAEAKDLLGPLSKPFEVATDALEVILPGFATGGAFKGARKLLGPDRLYKAPYARPLAEVLQTEVEGGRLSPSAAASIAQAADATGNRFGLAFRDRNLLGTTLGADLTEYLGTIRKEGMKKLGAAPGPEPTGQLPPGPVPPPGPPELTPGGPLPVPMPAKFPIKPGVDFQETWPTPPSRALPAASALGIWNQFVGGRPGTVINPNLPVPARSSQVWVAPPSNLPPPAPPAAPVGPPAAPVGPEFYKAEAAKLPGDVRYVGDMGGRPMFQDEGGAGSFMKAPEETIPEALARARARYETPKPAEPVSPVPAVPAETPPTQLSTGIPQADLPVQTPGQKFANVRDIKSKQKKAAAEPTTYDDRHNAQVSSLGTMISGFEPGKRITVNVDGEIGPGYGSTYPPWFKSVFPNDSAKAVATVIRRYEAGGKLSKRETRIMDSIHEMVKDSIDRGVDAATERPTAEPVSGNNIALGDSFRIEGEKFKAVGYEDGKLVIKDGVEHKLDFGESIQVDGGEDGITRATPEELSKTAEKKPFEIPKEDSDKLSDIHEDLEEYLADVDDGHVPIAGDYHYVDQLRKKHGMDLNDLRKMKKDIEDIFQAEKDAKGPPPGPTRGAKEAPKGQKDLIKDKSFKLAEEPVPEGPAPEFKPDAAGEQDELFPGERAKIRLPEKGAPAPMEKGGLWDPYRDIQPSVGHVAFIGDEEFFESADGALYKASIADPISSMGNRAGRFVSEKRKDWGPTLKVFRDIEFRRRNGEGGFIVPDLVAALIDGSKNIKNGLLRKFLPTSISPEHLSAAEVLGHKLGRASRVYAMQSSAMKKPSRMFVKMGVLKKGLKGTANPGHVFMSNKSVGRPQATSELQQISDLMDQFEKNDIQALTNAGADLKKVREHYFAGMWKDKVKATNFLAKRPFKGSESFRKGKVFQDWMDGIDAGLEPLSSNPVDIFLLKRREVLQSILANEALREYEANGDYAFKSIFKPMPEGFKHIDDRYSAVYGPPNVVVEEFIDEHQYEGLLKAAASLGIKHERKISAGQGRLGFAEPGTGKIVTQFATEITVLAHEISHQLDFKYNLWDKIVTQAEGIGAKGAVTKAASQKKRGTIQKELRALADLNWEGQQPSQYHKDYVRKKEEKMAHLLEAYIHAPERFKDVAPTVYDSFNSFLRSMPELKAFTEIKPGLALTRLQNTKSIGGFPLMGHRVFRAPVADIINNYTSRSMYNNPTWGSIFKGVMTVGNAMNQSQLGMGSQFHGGFTAGEVQISAGANILQDIFGIARGNRTLRQLGQSVLQWPTAMFMSPRAGGKLLSEWNTPGTQGFKMAQIAEAFELAGASFELERGLFLDHTEEMIRDWYSDRKALAAIRSPVALLGALSKPVMKWLVPRQKAFIGGEMMGRIIEQNPGVPLIQLRAKFRKAWNDVDQRLGQVVYNRIFMDNSYKAIIQMLIRAPGWTGGTIGQIGGAPFQAYDFFKEWKQTGKMPDDLPPKVAYTTSLILTTALANGLLTLAFTGENPEGMDWVAFRDGGVDEYGKPSRALLPTYGKEIWAWYKKPVETLTAKVHPALSTALEIKRGTNYYGVQITDPEANLFVRILQANGHFARAFVPFWMRGVAKQVERSGGYGEAIKSPIKTFGPLVGIMPASAIFTRTDAERLLGEMGAAQRPLGGSTKEQSDYQQLRARAIRLLRRGASFNDLPGDLQMKLGKLSEDKLSAIEKEAGTSWLSSRFDHRTVNEKIRVWKVMNKKEREEVADIFLAAMEKHYSEMGDDDPEKELFREKIENPEMAVEKGK